MNNDAVRSTTLHRRCKSPVNRCHSCRDRQFDISCTNADAHFKSMKKHAYLRGWFCASVPRNASLNGFGCTSHLLMTVRLWSGHRLTSRTRTAFHVCGWHRRWHVYFRAASITWWGHILRSVAAPVTRLAKRKGIGLIVRIFGRGHTPLLQPCHVTSHASLTNSLPY